MSGATLTSDLSTVEPASALSPRPPAGALEGLDLRNRGHGGEAPLRRLEGRCPTRDAPAGPQRMAPGHGRAMGRARGQAVRRGRKQAQALRRRVLQATGRETPETSSTGTLAFETIEEAVLTSTDLTGQGPRHRPSPSGSGAVTAIAYVRCEPLSAAEVRDIESDRSRTDTRRLISYNDGVSYSAGASCGTRRTCGR